MNNKRNNDHALAEKDDPENFVVPGMENVQPSELRIPLLKLVQAQSRIDNLAANNLGQWYNSVTGEFEANPEVIIIGVAKGRVWFPAQYNADNKPLCGSDDGATPRPDYVGLVIRALLVSDGLTTVTPITIPRRCEDCPLSQWSADGQPPSCHDVATFAGLDKSGLPVLIQVKSAGMKNVAALKTLIAANGVRKTIRLGSVQEKNNTGTYYVPVFTVGSKPDPEWQANAIRLAKLGNLAARNQAAIIEYENRQEPAEPDEPDEWIDTEVNEEELLI